MQVSHSHESEFTFANASDALGRLQRRISELMEDKGLQSDFERFEREVHAAFCEAEREVTAEGLQRQDIDLPYVVIDGKVHHRVLRSAKRYMGASGPVAVMRTLYRASRGERAVAALERRAGLIEGQWTALAARQGAMLVTHLPPQEAETVLGELGNMRPSKSSLDRLPKALSARWEAGRERFEASLRKRLEVPEQACTVSVSLDGVMVPMIEGERAGKRQQARDCGKRTQGPAGYQEAGCGTLSFFDAAGERLETLRMARMPEAKKATLKAMLAAELRGVLAKRPDLHLVKLADGAKDNWTFLSGDLPEGVELIDFYHAAEQLKDAFDAAYGENSPKALAPFEKYRHLLRHDLEGVGKVVRALAYLRRKHSRRQRIAQVLRYFRRNRARMGYAAAAAQNLPIGSGVVEAACKTLVGQRMKRSGMRWRNSGGQAILTLRGLVQSHRFGHGWRSLSQTYSAEVCAPENVVPLQGRIGM
jgi:hypothetical protein